MKKTGKFMIAAGLSACMILSFAGCGGKKNTEQTTAAAEAATEASTEQAGEAANTTALPYFQYNDIYGLNGFDPVEAAAYDYLAFEAEKNYDPDHAMIPYVKVVGMDDSKPEDVLLYGDYWLWEFEKKGDVLAAVSGGHRPGVIHMERFGEGDTAVYSALSMDEALTDDENEKVFGKYYEEYQKIASDDKTRDAGIEKVLADYVKTNQLDVTKYQIADGEVKDLPLQE